MVQKLYYHRQLMIIPLDCHVYSAFALPYNTVNALSDLIWTDNLLTDLKLQTNMEMKIFLVSKVLFFAKMCILKKIVKTS
jgi:hypothetical protein